MSTATAHSKPRMVLAPEPWGSRLLRAREQAGFTLRELDRASDVLEFGRGPIHAMEQMQTVPTKPMWRRRAYTYLTFLGFDPSDFGLTDDDAPRVIDLRVLRDLGTSPTKWYASVHSLDERRRRHQLPNAA
jgi:hypothetical protein